MDIPSRCLKKIEPNPEHSGSILRKILKSHEICVLPHLFRSSNKNGVVKRNSETFWSVLEKICKEITDSTPSTLIARALRLINMFNESTILSSSQLVRGYTPSIVNFPATKVHPKIFEAHVQLSAHR